MTATSQAVIQDATRIPPLTHAEAGVMARTELERFLALVNSLSGDDWDQPTDCTLWDVRHILAHQAASYASFASWSQFKRQWSGALKPQPGQLPVDALNQIQIADRAEATPAELIAELAEVGPKAIATRQGLPLVLRALRVPFGPPLGFVRVDYLTDLIYPRDTWCHRLDICRATGREMILTAEHDGRIMALVMRDLAAKIKRELKGITVGYELTGPAGGCWRVGSNGRQSAIIRMNPLDFSRLTSDRLTADEVRAQSLAVIGGDTEIANQVLEHASVPY